MSKPVWNILLYSLIICLNYIVDSKVYGSPDLLSTSTTTENEPTTTENNLPQVNTTTELNNGDLTNLVQFPWLVNLEYQRGNNTRTLRPLCAGSLINNRYVLTAAHCLTGLIKKDYGNLVSVRLGDNSNVDCDDNVVCQDTRERVAIDSIYSHPDYATVSFLNDRKLRYPNDIGLIRLNREVEFSEIIKPVRLPKVNEEAELTEGIKLTAAGWNRFSDVRLNVELPYVNTEKCREYLTKRFFLTDKQICAGGEARNDSCQIDSGGPLMRLSSENQWILEGIISFGFRCSQPIPEIYTNIRHYIDWINENVNI